jgi:hypothetical protein
MGKKSNKKAYIENPFEHGDVINYILDGVSIHPVTTKTRASFLRKENHSGISPGGQW